jgi:flagellum-specific ATP synthase
VNAVLDLSPYHEAVRRRSLYRYVGYVDRVTGLVIESRGPRVGVGDLCEIRVRRNGPTVLAEVVGFRGERVQLMSYGAVQGISQGAEVAATHRPFLVPVGDRLLGRVVDAFGSPIDGRPDPEATEMRPVEAIPPGPLSRSRIDAPIGTGVRAIDGFTTLGRGQRIGVFSGSGVGKSTLLGMIARNTDADVNVIALVGERGREVREFIEKDLGDEGLSRSVIVVSTSDEPALARVKGALTAMTIAEHFRDAGKNVMLLMDSVTRVAMALREVGLSVGEPPTSRGYTPSVFAFLPPFLERAGGTGSGSITGVFTVLVEADDVNDPIGDATRGILDGHIVLSRDLAARNHYPAIDVLGSVSRVMMDVAGPEHRDAAGALRSMLATYAHYEDLVTVGAYRRGQNTELDRALHFLPRLEAVLRQRTDERTSLSDVQRAIVALASEAASFEAKEKAA